jgi:hypothetical protein
VDARKKLKLQEPIADARAFKEPELTPAQVALRDAHVAALAKNPDYPLECARAGGTTPAKLNAFRPVEGAGHKANPVPGGFKQGITCQLLDSRSDDELCA